MQVEDEHVFGRTGVERMNRAFHVSEIVLREMQDLPDLNLKKDLDYIQGILDEVLLVKNLPLVDLTYSEDDYIDMAASPRILA